MRKIILSIFLVTVIIPALLAENPVEKKKIPLASPKILFSLLAMAWELRRFTPAIQLKRA